MSGFVVLGRLVIVAGIALLSYGRIQRSPSVSAKLYVSVRSKSMTRIVDAVLVS
ncbi:hypothetical protein AWB64_05241 [Caballeronia sordidicola]|uniref:Uncharacterized protein n=1 Tax=Caballeronia sordidicola TaxID=196367 RepID=A0A158I0M8_CABSO|nr:hypothetical protein AWB64_05241 [Caballeronia sordidicola]